MAGEYTDWKQLATVVHEVLIREWGPIGCGVPDDEYDSYIPGILRLLMGGADEVKIGSHLEHLQTSNMGLQGNRERNQRIAHLLLQRTGGSASAGQPQSFASQDQPSADD